MTTHITPVNRKSLIRPFLFDCPGNIKYVFVLLIFAAFSWSPDTKPCGESNLYQSAEEQLEFHNQAQHHLPLRKRIPRYEVN